METAQFKYFEYQQVGSDIMSAGERKRINIGSFTEKIEIEDEDYMHERLDVPPILESRRSTVVHDFEKVKYVYFDNCFYMISVIIKFFKSFKIGICCVVFGSAQQSVLESLDRVQNVLCMVQLSN